jgi:vacuolar-type H+-ATPase subunit D/Vma8
MKSAAKGKELLKRKADSLKVKFRAILKDLIEKKKNLGKLYNDALIYLAKANWSAGEVR